MVSGFRCRVSVSEDRKQMKNCKMKRPLCSLFIVFCHPFTDTRHLKPVLLKKKIDKSDPFFVNYLRDATLVAKPPDGPGILTPIFLDFDEQFQIYFGAQQTLDLFPGSSADLLELASVFSDNDALLRIAF